ncbi:MAG: hypothetical protein ACYC0C_05855 [Devosia sp.]
MSDKQALMYATLNGSAHPLASKELAIPADERVWFRPLSGCSLS